MLDEAIDVHYEQTHTNIAVIPPLDYTQSFDVNRRMDLIELVVRHAPNLNIKLNKPKLFGIGACLARSVVDSDVLVSSECTKHYTKMLFPTESILLFDT